MGTDEKIAALVSFSTGEIQRMRKRANAEFKKGFRYLVLRISHETLRLDGEPRQIPTKFEALPGAYVDPLLATAAAARESQSKHRTNESIRVLDIAATRGKPDLVYLNHRETRKL